LPKNVDPSSAFSARDAYQINIHAVRQIGRNFVGETEAATDKAKNFL